MKMFLKILLLSVVLLGAALTYKIKTSLSTQYMLEIAGDTLSMMRFKSNFKSNFKGACPGFNGADRTGCLKNYIASLTVKSSTQAMLMSAVVFDAVSRDSKEGSIAPEDRKFVACDLVLSVFERTNTAQLHVSEMKATTDEEKAELKTLRNQEESFLKRGVDKFADTCSQSTTELSKSRTISSSGVSEASKVEQLKKRIETLRSRQWVL